MMPVAANSVENQSAAVAAELTRPLPRGRTLFSYGMSAIAFGLTGVALMPLVAILIEILWRGLPRLTGNVFVALPEVGFANAITGTLLMVGVAALISVPVGVMTGIFLSEGQTAASQRSQAVASAIRFIATILSGVPSIIVGVFAWGVVVRSMGGFSALAGGFALSIIMLPVVALTTEAALKLVPTEQRLASAALGANRLQTTRLVITAALSGITTGVLLAVARAAGETAPLLFTALFSQNWPEGLLNPAPSLSVLIYNYANSPAVEQNQLAWTASLVLVAIVLLTSILSRLFTRSLTR